MNERRSDIYFFGMQRALARALDNLILFGLIYIANPASASQPTPMAIFVFFAIATVLDCVCTYLFGRSIGKLFLGLRVVSDNGQPLDLLTTVKRSLCIWLFGYAAGITALATIAQLLSVGYYIQNGKAIWDDWTATCVTDV